MVDNFIMKKQEFELEIEKLCEQIFFNEKLLEFINVHNSYILQFAKALRQSLDCEVIRGGPDTGIFGSLHMHTLKNINWIEIYAGTKALIEIKNVFGHKRYLTISASKLSNMVNMSSDSGYSLLLNDVMSTGFLAGIEFDFLRYKKRSSITISKSRSRAAQEYGGTILENVKLIHNLSTGNTKSFEDKPDLKYNLISLAIEYHHYNMILNTEGTGKDATVRKIYLSRGSNLSDYFEKEGSLDIFHLDVKGSPLFNDNMGLDPLDGIYLSWKPHIIDVYLLEEAQKHPRFPQLGEDIRQDQESGDGEEAA
ncbi:hypothetical protein BALOs_2279 [Halobacteriovorax sp. BALOs_7]|nr:hypothetical protein BALOs_2279 [Halobacteriovorax sp. BALOs_7]